MDKGLADELTERRFLVVDGIDGKAHYVRLADGIDTGEFAIGAIVEVRGAHIRAADREVQAQARDGIYRPSSHQESLRRAGRAPDDAAEFVTAHVRRLEALRRGGIVERISDDAWMVPEKLPELGQEYEAKRLAGADVQLLSHLPIEKQARAVGATWLDQRLADEPASIPESGFGSEVRTAMRTRLRFLVDEGLAERRGGRVVMAGNILATLRQRDLARAADLIQLESGLAYRPATDGQRLNGIYRRSLHLASGRFAMIESEGGFALVPWRPILEKRLEQAVSGIVRGTGISWEFGRRRGLGV